jgi:penicillin V acylase-like amidase (Ntn superfamily)
MAPANVLARPRAGRTVPRPLPGRATRAVEVASPVPLKAVCRRACYRLRVRTLVAVLLVVAARPAFPCSAFLRDGPAGPVMGKSYDWDDERGLVLVNKRGMEKRALVLSPGETPATWRSRLASLTFNQYGRELPNGGINEAGLAVEVLVLPDTAYEKPDGRPVVTELGLVQYVLDQASTTSEAVELAHKVRVDAVHAQLHYFVCDARATCATLEFLRGALVVSTAEAMPVRAVTNSRYAASIGARTRPTKNASSLGRFVRLADQLEARSKGDPVAAAFASLDSVRFEDSTQWQIVYELRARRVHFRSRRHPSVKTVALGDFPSACAEPVMMLDLASDHGGDVASAFVPYREEANRALVEATLRSRRAELPAGTARRVAAHPATQVCAP